MKRREKGKGEGEMNLVIIKIKIIGSHHFIIFDKYGDFLFVGRNTWQNMILKLILFLNGNVKIMQKLDENKMKLKQK